MLKFGLITSYKTIFTHFYKKASKLNTLDMETFENYLHLKMGGVRGGLKIRPYLHRFFVNSKIRVLKALKCVQCF